ncbi:MAG: T9SS type A sorting domain-containing protein [Candidatus Zixiibacteriota bacterium]|nr:MAG: T9SS type A sorting domain-containing protein [candidate division Zixibacteria bacterium]
MKKMAMVTVLSACLLSLLLAAGVTQAKDLDKQAELLDRTLLYERTLTVSEGISSEQRSLLAVTMASTETQITDPEVLYDAYRKAMEFTTYLLMSDTGYTWNGLSWDNQSRTTYVYGSGNRESSETEQLWIGATWVNSSRNLFSYDGSGRMDTSTSQDWVSTDWVNANRSILVYSGGNLYQMIFQEWRDSVGGVWVNNFRTTLTYSSGRVDSSVMEMWDVDAFVNTSKTTYGYDGGGHLTQLLSQIWTGDDWYDMSRITYYLDSSGRDTLALSEAYAGIWSNSSKTQSAYDGEGNETLSVFWTWTNPTWTKVSADTMKYQTSQLIESVYYTVSGNILNRTQYTYDANGNGILDLHQMFSGTWLNTSKEVYVFQAALAVEVDNGRVPSVFKLSQNYPNPFNPITAIRYSLHRPSQVSITVFNVLGQEVKTLESGMQSAGTYETTWDGTNQAGQEVASGIYFYRIKAGENIETRKMVLLK